MLCPHCKKNRPHYKNGYCIFCWEELYTEKTNLPKVVNQDFINELKIRGKKQEVKNWLKTFQDSIHKEKKTDLVYFNRKIVQIKKTQGYCSNIWCDNKTDGQFAQCERCRVKHREYNKRYQQNRK